jgi:hypothetical protein
MLTSMSQSTKVVGDSTRHASCPSCGHHGEFVYLGAQHWPERVAKAAGISPVVYLWDCQSCHSTISEQNLG